MLLSEFAQERALWLLIAGVDALFEESEVALVGIPVVKSPFLFLRLLTFVVMAATAQKGLNKAALRLKAWEIVNLTVGMGDV
jgi:hypothetical protein